MKIKIEVTVEVDQTQWSDTYGVENTKAAVREDVREWAKHALLGAQEEGLVDLA